MSFTTSGLRVIGLRAIGRRVHVFCPHLALCVLLGMMSGLAAGCAQAPEEPQPVRFGLIISRATFPGQEAYYPMSIGAELATEAINARGGIDVAGQMRRLELRVENDRERPEEAVDAMRRLINQQEVVALIGPVISRTALAAARVAEAKEVPMITPSASHPEITAGRRYVFRATFDDNAQGRLLARFARQTLGSQRAALLYDLSGAYNRTIAAVFAAAFLADGGEVVAREEYVLGEQDFRPALRRIAAAEPDVLLLPNYRQDIPNQAAQAREIGLGANLLGGDSWDGEPFARLPDLEGAFFLVDWHAVVGGPRAEPFIAAYQESIGMPPPSTAALTYDAIGLVVAAIEAAGSTESEAIRRQLTAMRTYSGITGDLEFLGGEPIKSAVVLEMRGGAHHLRAVVEAERAD